jgi:hypothetical protein
MVPLSHVLAELRLVVHNKIELDTGEWMFLLTRVGCTSQAMPADEDCMYIYSGVEDDPYIWEEEAETIRRHFKPPRSPRGGIITLGL